MLGVGQVLFDIFYPIGTYYETSDTNFDPNTANSWYGTWVEDTAGRVLVGLDTSQTEFKTVGNTGGSKYIQNHKHKDVQMANNHLTAWNSRIGSTGVVSLENLITSNGTANENYFLTGDVYNATTGNSGNLQPYIVIKRWHRIA